MKFIIKPLVVLTTLIGGSLASQLAMAATETSTTDVDAMVKQINSQTQALEKQVLQLKREVKRLKMEQEKTAAAPKAPVAAAKPAAKTESTVANDPSFKMLSPLIRMGSSPVVIAPYIGVPSQYDASDLIVYQSSYKLDKTMLERYAAYHDKMAAEGIETPNTPVLILSGKLESQIYSNKTYSGDNDSDIDLTGAELFAAVHVNNWVSGLLTFNYNNAPPSGTNQQRVTNSNVNVDQAFATIGNFRVSPFYATAGQRTLPFGQFNTYMLSDTLAKSMFKLLERSVLLGYDSQNMNGVFRPYASTFVFKDDTRTANGGGDNINNVGANLGLRIKTNSGWNSDVGVSGVANVADSNGMQSTGLDAFPGFSNSEIVTVDNTIVNGENQDRKVPGFNAYAGIGNDKVYFTGEYVGATSSFTANNLTYNDHGAKPSAVHGEGVYMFNIANFPANVGIGYDHTWQALALNMPQQRYITALNVSFIRNTIMTLEFNRWINYGASDTASGMNSAIIQPTGHYQNNMALQFGVYF